MNDDWNMQRALIDKEAVRGFAVVSQAFSVVRRKDDQRMFQQVMRSEIVPEFTDYLVDVVQLAAIAPHQILSLPQR